MTVTTIIFSKNRPLQLDLTISSLFLNCLDIRMANLAVLWKADPEYQSAYKTLKEEHATKNIFFIEEDNFRDDLLTIIGNKSDFLFFIVDDCIFTNQFRLEEIVKYLNESENNLGFSLRLGRNTHYVYTMDREQEVPKMWWNYESKIQFFNWSKAEYDFSYPLEVSSSVFRSEDVLPIIRKCLYNNPNVLEGLFAYFASTFRFTKPFLFCYETSRAFCSPINRVQNVAPCNRFGNGLNHKVEHLLDLYQDKIRVNPKKFEGFISNSVHQEVDLF